MDPEFPACSRLLFLTFAAFLSGGATPGRADLIVVRPGGAGPSALVRLEDFTGAYLGQSVAETEGYYGLCVGPDQNLYVTSSVLGGGEVHRFDRAGRSLGSFARDRLTSAGGL